MTRKPTPDADTHGATRVVPGAAPVAEGVDPPGSERTNEGSAGPAAMSDGEVITQLKTENAELKDRLLRALAEVENVRRRTARELKDARQYAVANFAGDMLNVADNMERAIASVPADARESDAAVKTLIGGVELTEKEMLRLLEKHGVRKLDPKGQRFDPHFHQAMFEVADPSVPHGTVTQVMQAGYSIGSRVLRPAKVAVASGGIKPVDA
jgi:molecular chaperone GrpE